MSSKIDRRDLLKLFGLAGIGALGSAASFFSSDADAAGQHGGPYWIMLNAGGGWDPAYICDPKIDPTMNRLSSEVAYAGNLPYSPIDFDPTAFGLTVPAEGDDAPFPISNKTFFEKYQDRLLVINGINTQTNSHTNGSRTMWSGRIPEGYPSLAALIAGALGADKPMAFLSSGGYSRTMNVVPLTRVGSSSSTLKRIVYPNRINVDKPENGGYHEEAAYESIAKYQKQRLAAQRAASHLPVVSQSMDALYLARQATADLQQFVPPESVISVPGISDLQTVVRSAQLALAAFKSGVAISANLTIGGFDTHANHDTAHVLKVAKLLATIDYIAQESQRLGLADKMNVVVASDFGRGPFFNGTSAGSGKNHWPITSVMMMGPSFPGNKVIGETTAEHQQKLVDPQTLKVSTSSGIGLQPEHLHRALRRAAGIDNSDLTNNFPLSGEDLDLFG
jgi:uncharacterized protein (DUF1501 family)